MRLRTKKLDCLPLRVFLKRVKQNSTAYLLYFELNNSTTTKLHLTAIHAGKRKMEFLQFYRRILLT